jgi:hypothetical protein
MEIDCKKRLNGPYLGADVAQCKRHRNFTRAPRLDAIGFRFETRRRLMS